MSNYQHKVIVNLDEEDEKRVRAMWNEDNPRKGLPVVAIGRPRFEGDNSPDFDDDTLYPGDIISFAYSYRYTADGYKEYVIIFYGEGCEIIDLPTWQEVQEKHTGKVTR